MKSFAFHAPSRLDFGGGWSDVPPYDAEQGGFVCNVAITRRATVRVRALENPEADAEFKVERAGDLALLRAAVKKLGVRGASFSLSNDFPVAAGLGGSSAASVAAISASLHWLGRSMSREEIAEASRELEILDLGIAGGRQDHYAAAFGGALGLRFGPTVDVTPLSLSAKVLTDLPRRCIVIYTGESRISANTITAVMSAYSSGNATVRSALGRMRDLAVQMADALGAGDLDSLGALVGEHWQHQRSLDPAIPTPLIDSIIESGMKAGAQGCKALGASGGGCVLLIAPLNRVDEVRRAVSALGTEITFSIDTEGARQCG